MNESKSRASSYKLRVSNGVAFLSSMSPSPRPSPPQQTFEQFYPGSNGTNAYSAPDPGALLTQPVSKSRPLAPLFDDRELAFESTEPTEPRNSVMFSPAEPLPRQPRSISDLARRTTFPSPLIYHPEDVIMENAEQQYNQRSREPSPYYMPISSGERKQVQHSPSHRRAVSAGAADFLEAYQFQQRSPESSSRPDCCSNPSHDDVNPVLTQVNYIPFSD